MTYAEWYDQTQIQNANMFVEFSNAYFDEGRVKIKSGEVKNDNGN